MRVTTALSSGLRASTRETAASSSSAGLTSRPRTSSASPRPSKLSNSSAFMDAPLVDSVSSTARIPQDPFASAAHASLVTRSSPALHVGPGPQRQVAGDSEERERPRQLPGERDAPQAGGPSAQQQP